MIDAAALLGTWSLEDYVFRYSDGGEKPFYAAGATGRLHYLADGWMSAHLMAQGREAVDENLHALNEKQLRALAGSYFSYGGRWTLEGDWVRHDVEVCLQPLWIGRAVWRQAAFADGLLTLTAPKTQRGSREGTAVLTWKRAALL